MDGDTGNFKHRLFDPNPAFREHYGECLQPTLVSQTMLLLPPSLLSPRHAAGMVGRGEGGLILLAGFFLLLDLCELLS